MNLQEAKDHIHHLPSPALLLNLHGQIVAASPSGETLMSEFRETNLLNFESPFWEQQTFACASGGRHSFSIDFTAMSTKLHCSMLPVIYKEGAFLWVSFIAVKNTSRDETEVQDDYIQNLKIKEMSEMAATIAHEINNPLTIIYARVHSLLEALPQSIFESHPEIRESLKKISTHAERIFQVVSGMRSFSRDARKDSFVHVKVGKSLEEALSLLKARTRDRGIEIEFTEVRNDLKVFGRPSELIQVFLNLATNATDAMENTLYPKITIEVEETAERVFIYFSDTGPGVSAENEVKIFAPFFTTKPVGQGTGIGLSISTKIIKSHNGDLRLDRSRGPSCFVIELPKAEAFKTTA